jgi:predicted RNA methylase
MSADARMTWGTGPERQLVTARSTFTISDSVRDVLARSTITATSVALPEQLDRKLYTEVNKALAGAGGKWSRKDKAHIFDRDPREVLGLAVETGKATNVRTKLQAFYTPGPLAARMVAAVSVALLPRAGQAIRMLEPSIGEGALAKAAANAWAAKYKLTVIGYDIDPIALQKSKDHLHVVEHALLDCQDFLSVDHGETFDVVLMNPPFSGGADIVHVTHAWKFVRPGGALVAIMSPRFQHASTKAAIAFRGLLESLGVRAETEDIEPGTFEHTGVATVLVLMRKPG